MQITSILSIVVICLKFIAFIEIFWVSHINLIDKTDTHAHTVWRFLKYVSLAVSHSFVLIKFLSSKIASLKICNGVSWKAEILWYHFVLILGPDVKFGYINSVVQSLTWLSNLETWFADDDTLGEEHEIHSP